MEESGREDAPPLVTAMIVKDTGAVWNEGLPNDWRASTTLLRPFGAAH